MRCAQQNLKALDAAIEFIDQSIGSGKVESPWDLTQSGRGPFARVPDVLMDNCGAQA